MREQAEGIERARAEEEAKARAEDDMIKMYGGKSPLEPRQGGSSLRRKARSVRLMRCPRQKMI